jgi:hypothetical protein
MALAPGGKTLAASYRSGHLILWDTSSGKALHQIETGDQIEKGEKRDRFDLVFSPDGKTLAGGRDQEVWLFDVSSGRSTRRLENHPHPIRAVAFSANGSRLIVIGSARGGSEGQKVEVVATLWNTRTWKRVREFAVMSAARENLLGVTCSLVAGGAYLTCQEIVAYKPGDAWVWALPSGRLVSRIDKTHLNSTWRCALSPDGRLFAAEVTPSEVWLCELATGRVRQKLPETAWAAYAPTGDMLVAWEPGEEHTVHVYDLAATPEPRMLLTAAHGPLGFSPDGRFLATSEDDGSILLWDLSARARPWADAPPSLREQADLWSELAHPDAQRADLAIRRLLRHPAQAVALLASHLAPAAGDRWGRIARLAADLDDDSFAVREAASRELARVGSDARPALETLLDDPPSVEAKRRATELLVDLETPRGSAEAVRQLRAVEVLERVGNAKARELLRTLAGGDPGAPLTLDARASLRRLAVRAER